MNWNYLLKYPGEYILIWLLIAIAIAAILVMLILIFTHRFIQNKQDLKKEEFQIIIDDFFAKALASNTLTAKSIDEKYAQLLPFLKPKLTAFRYQLAWSAVRLIDKLGYGMQSKIEMIIEQLDLKKIIVKDINSRNTIKQIKALNAMQVLNENLANTKVSGRSTLVKQKCEELSVVNNLTTTQSVSVLNNWQKTFILHYLLKNKKMAYSKFNILLIQPDTPSNVQFAAEVKELLGAGLPQDFFIDQKDASL